MDAIRQKTVSFAVEALDEYLYVEICNLTPLHWQEIAPYQDMLLLNPDRELYFKMQRLGCLQVVTARCSGELVGYLVNMIARHPHYVHILTATEDIHYLRPEYRQGWTGVRLVKHAEIAAKARGCQLITGRAKAKSGHGALYKRLGYDLMDEVYTKRLGD